MTHRRRTTQDRMVAPRTSNAEPPDPPPTPAPGDPRTVLADHPVIHMTAAFAREQDARFAVGILTSSAGHLLSSAIRPVEGAGGRIDVILLEVEIVDLEAD